MHWAEGLLERSMERSDRGFVATSWHWEGVPALLKQLKFPGPKKSEQRSRLFRYYSMVVDDCLDRSLKGRGDVAVRVISPKDHPSTIFAFYVVEPTCQLVYRHVHHKLRPRDPNDLKAVEQMLHTAASSFLDIPISRLVSTWHPFTGLPFQPGMVHAEFERMLHDARNRTAQG